MHGFRFFIWLVTLNIYSGFSKILREFLYMFGNLGCKKAFVIWLFMSSAFPSFH